jgi:hypothetical protein
MFNLRATVDYESDILFSSGYDSGPPPGGDLDRFFSEIDSLASCVLLP